MQSVTLWRTVKSLPVCLKVSKYKIEKSSPLAENVQVILAPYLRGFFHPVGPQCLERVLPP